MSLFRLFSSSSFFFFFFWHFFSHTVNHPYQTFTSGAFGIQISNLFAGRECSASEKFLLSKSMTTFLFKLVSHLIFLPPWLFIGFTIQVACSSFMLSFKGKLHSNWNWAYFISLEESHQHMVLAYAEN